jgi:hypothetical protein
MKTFGKRFSNFFSVNITEIYTRKKLQNMFLEIFCMLRKKKPWEVRRETVDTKSVVDREGENYSNIVLHQNKLFGKSVGPILLLTLLALEKLVTALKNYFSHPLTFRFYHSYYLGNECVKLQKREHRSSHHRMRTL